MAKLISKPKTPSLPVIPETPAPVIESTEVAATPPEPTADEIRAQNILRRRRGRLGTVETSLSGAFSANAASTANTVPARKTLLGE